MILGLDPGGTTGVCDYDVVNDDWTFSQIGPGPHHLALWRLLCKWEPSIIVCEKFEFRHDLQRDKIVYDSAEYIGVVRLFAQTHGEVDLVMQSASQAKAFWTNDKLKKLDLYEPSHRHAMDALRHVLYYRAFTMKDQTVFEGLK